MCVGSFKEPLDLAEKRFVHSKSEVLTSSSRLSNWSESLFNASRTSRNRSASLFVYVVQFAAPRSRVRRDELIICSPDLLVKGEVRSPATAAVLRVFVKDTGKKEGIIANVRAEQESLFRSRVGECDQHIGDVLASSFFTRMWCPQTVHAGKGLEE